MKKILILILLICLATGCTNLSNQDLDGIVSSMLEKENTLYNVVFDGYKYYLPKGLKFVSKDDYNAHLLDGKNNSFYLYVDVLSYYNNTKLDYEENKDAYYSKKLDYRNQEGYLEITEIGENGYYFIEYMYHYGKMEAYVKEEDIKDAVTYMSSVLSSLTFNRTVLETLIGNNIIDYKEETYDVMKPKGNNVTQDTYLDYVERYDNYEEYGNNDTDEDSIDINITE
ncbi:MAG TPA: hypothetical protein IAC24_05250 [Candidatus Onthousia faecigallinarum]|nr:hypothetical protein [Candidatus Onthousia faecigallinarum]